MGFNSGIYTFLQILIYSIRKYTVLTHKWSVSSTFTEIGVVASVKSSELRRELGQQSFLTWTDVCHCFIRFTVTLLFAFLIINYHYWNNYSRIGPVLRWRHEVFSLETIINYVSFLGLSNFFERCNQFQRRPQPKLQIRNLLKNNACHKNDNNSKQSNWKATCK